MCEHDSRMLAANYCCRIIDAREVAMARWLIDVDASDDDTIQAYAGDSFAFGTEHDMYVAYVVVTTFIERMKKNVDKEDG